MPMLYVPDSWLGFATALVACQLLAAAWYSPALFGRHWRTALGKAALPASEPPAQARILAANAVMIYLLVSLLHWTASGQTSGAALGMATLLWLGFVAGSSALRTASEGRSWTLWKINNGYTLVCLLVSALLIVWL